MNICKASDKNISTGPSKKVVVIYPFLVVKKLLPLVSLLLILSLSHLTNNL